MRDDFAIAAQYREHAEELRIVANENRPTWANEALLKAADDYDRLAAGLARQDVLMNDQEEEFRREVDEHTMWEWIEDRIVMPVIAIGLVTWVVDLIWSAT